MGFGVQSLGCRDVPGSWLVWVWNFFSRPAIYLPAIRNDVNRGRRILGQEVLNFVGEEGSLTLTTSHSLVYTI